MNNEKASQQIQKLEQNILQRFRTRGSRRAERYPLSTLWPQIWLPKYIKSNISQEKHIFTLQHSTMSQPQRECFRIQYENGALSVVDLSSAKVVLSLPNDRSWLSLKFNNLQLTEERGFFHIKSKERKAKKQYFIAQPPHNCRQESGGLVLIEGLFIQVNEQSEVINSSKALPWRMSLQLIDDQERPSLRVKVSFDSSEWENTVDMEPRIAIHLVATSSESIFGMGAQLTWLDLKGRVVPSWVQEPGIGRGIQPLTWFMENIFNAGGSDVQSSAPAPIYLTSLMQAHALENYAFSLFDFSQAQLRSIEVWSDELSLRVFGGSTSPETILKSISNFTGTMPPLPSWVHQGAIIGAQGGTQRIKALWSQLQEADVEVAAFWLQDWVGKRETSVGEQLWWDWQLDNNHYPDWDELKSNLKQREIKLLGYVNPYLVETTERETNEIPSQKSLFEIADQKGFLVPDIECPTHPLMIKNTSFSAAIVDLSNPEAFEWLKQIIKERLVEIGLSGWMADFGEALPVEAQLQTASGLELHNHFPVLWAKLNREVIEELDGHTEEYLFFNRSGFTHSPKYSQLTWLGDHLTSWKKYDGIYSGLVGLLSSGFSGVTLCHSDAGGYICTDPPRSRLRVPFMSHARSPELLMRWVEMNTFSAVLRTHEGNQPNRHHQIYDDKRTLDHFSKMSKLFKALMPLRVKLMEKIKDGIPLVAHPWIFYPDDPHCLELQEQMMLGRDLMIAPVIRKGWSTVKLYLPEGEWGHWWSGETIEGPQWMSVPAPLGEPAVFYRCQSQAESIAKQWRKDHH